MNCRYLHLLGNQHACSLVPEKEMNPVSAYEWCSPLWLKHCPPIQQWKLLGQMHKQELSWINGNSYSEGHEAKVSFPSAAHLGSEASSRWAAGCWSYAQWGEELLPPVIQVTRRGWACEGVSANSEEQFWFKKGLQEHQALLRPSSSLLWNLPAWGRLEGEKHEEIMSLIAEDNSEGKGGNDVKVNCSNKRTRKHCECLVL